MQLGPGLCHLCLSTEALQPTARVTGMSACCELSRVGDLSDHFLACKRASAGGSPPFLLICSSRAQAWPAMASRDAACSSRGGVLRGQRAAWRSVPWGGLRWASGHSLCRFCWLSAFTLCCVQDSTMVLGLIETVDTVMGHISSNLDPSEPQVTIVGSSSMAGTGQLGVGCGHGCRRGGGSLGRAAGLWGLL